MVVVKNVIKNIVNSPYMLYFSLVSSEEAGITFLIFFLPPLILFTSKCLHPLDHLSISHLLGSTYSAFTNILSASIETGFWYRTLLNAPDPPVTSTSTNLHYGSLQETLLPLDILTFLKEVGSPHILILQINHPQGVLLSYFNNLNSNLPIP